VAATSASHEPVAADRVLRNVGVFRFAMTGFICRRGP
jgi:hypothetical protein